MRTRSKWVALSFALVLASIGVAAVPPPDAPAVQGECIGRILGAKYPDLVPAYATWDNLFEAGEAARRTNHMAALANLLQIDEATAARVADAGSAGRARARALKATALPPDDAGGLAHQRDIAAAEVILETRDDMLRSLSGAHVTSLLKHAAGLRRTLTVELDAPGKLVWPIPGDPPTCLVTVDGSEFPHLIPEAYVWEAYFHLQAAAAEDHRTSDGKYTDDYIQALRQHHLPIPEADINTVIDIAREAFALVEAKRHSPQSDVTEARETDAQVAAIVDSYSVTLLQRLQRSSWRAVIRDMMRIRTGTEFTFPTEPRK